LDQTSTTGGTAWTPSAGRAGNDYDALADLFLSGSPLGIAGSKPIIDMPALQEGGPALKLAPTPSTQPLHGTVGVRLEALLVGHTPGLGAAWVTQYARHESEASRAPVALLRTQAGRMSLEVFGLHGAHDAQPATLADALKAALDITTRLVVRVDEVDEPELLTHAALTDVTMLTGADDPAVVACYRSMKQVRGLLEQRAERADEPVAARLALVGAGATRADAAHEKLRRAAEAFLSHELLPAVQIEKIHAGPRPFVLFYGEAAQTTTELLDLIARIRGVGASATRVQASHATNQVAAVAQPAQTFREEVPASRVGVPSRAVAAPTIGSHDLVACIEGLSSMDAQCPYATHVRFSLDVDGKLHLLAEPKGGFDAVQELLAAAAWSRDHATLLAKIDRRLTGWDAPDGGLSPTLHVLTEDARTARGLFDSAIRVHVLSRISVGGREMTVAKLLN
jgi:hypothetical protein